MKLKNKEKLMQKISKTIDDYLLYEEMENLVDKLLIPFRKRVAKDCEYNTQQGFYLAPEKDEDDWENRFYVNTHTVTGVISLEAVADGLALTLLEKLIPTLSYELLAMFFKGGMLDKFCLRQNITFSIHSDNYTLDKIITLSVRGRNISEAIRNKEKV